MTRSNDRMMWILRRMCDKFRCPFGMEVAWDQKFVDDFVNAFPEAKKTLIYYMLGANSSPMLNRAAKRAERLGYLTAGHIGNQDARQYNQRTWCRTWSITEAGQRAVAQANERPRA